MEGETGRRDGIRPDFDIVTINTRILVATLCLPGPESWDPGEVHLAVFLFAVFYLSSLFVKNVGAIICEGQLIARGIDQRSERKRRVFRTFSASCNLHTFKLKGHLLFTQDTGVACGEKLKCVCPSIRLTQNVTGINTTNAFYMFCTVVLIK